jgi:hypothetical protein
MIKVISGRIYGTPSPDQWRYYLDVLHHYRRTGTQIAFRYY